MVAVDALIGGEGNGGVMLPDSHIGRDSIVAASLILMVYYTTLHYTPTSAAIPLLLLLLS